MATGLESDIQIITILYECSGPFIITIYIECSISVDRSPHRYSRFDTIKRDFIRIIIGAQISIWFFIYVPIIEFSCYKMSGIASCRRNISISIFCFHSSIISIISCIESRIWWTHGSCSGYESCIYDIYEVTIFSYFIHISSDTRTRIYTCYPFESNEEKFFTTKWIGERRGCWRNNIRSFSSESKCPRS